MPDLNERLRRLDRLDPPDLWPAIHAREPRSAPTGDRWRRLGVALLALAITSAAIGLAARALISGRTVTVSPITPKSNGRIAFVGGQSVVRVPFGGDVSLYTVAPDGTGIAPLVDGLQGVSGMSWSPGGDRLVFGQGGGEFSPSTLFTVNADGSDLRPLTEARSGTVRPVHDGAAAWSPEGDRIAFATDRSGTESNGAANFEIYLIHPDGTGLTRLTENPGSDTSPAWSPDASTIAFVRDGAINVMNADGTDVRKLADCAPSECFGKEEPVWSPNGSRIAFIHDADPHYQIRVMNADGSEERTLLDCRGSCLGLVGPLAWSPDGSRIAFTEVVNDRNATRRLVVMNQDGTDAKEVDSGSLEACCPAWQALSPAVPTETLPSAQSSPTMVQPSPPPPHGVLLPTPAAGPLGDIAYQRFDGRADWVWVVHPDGSEPRRLAKGGEPGWSPDGALLAFRTNFAGGRADVAVMNADGSDQHTIVSGVRSVPFLGAGGAPSWSPDGSRLVFASEEGLFVVDAGGGNIDLLAGSPDCVEYDPAWSPDGSEVVFAVGCTEETSKDQAGIVVVDALDGTGWHRIVGRDGLAQFPPNNPVWSPDGRYVAFDTVLGEGSFGTIYIARADGSNVIEFESGIQATWSPDGAALAYSFQAPQSSQADIYMIGVDGSGRRQVTSTNDVESNAAWQPVFGTS